MDSTATRPSTRQRVSPPRSIAVLHPAVKSAAIWLKLRGSVLAPVALLPLLLAAALIYGGRPASWSALVIVAPALFYSGFAIAFLSRYERKQTRRQAHLQGASVRRVDEFSPNEVRLSRHYFETRLAQEINRSRRHGLPLCVVTLSTPTERDKAVHTSQLVELTARVLRAEDCAGRLGRNVYAISLPHTTPAGAAVVIERLRQGFDGKQARFGLAYLEPGRDATPEQLLDAAISSPADASAG